MDAAYVNGNEPATPQPQPEAMSIRFRDAGGYEVVFKLKNTTKLGKAMDAYSAKAEKAVDTLRFLFDGERVLKTHTPADLEMGEDDTIEVHMEQIGGGGAGSGVQ